MLSEEISKIKSTKKDLRNFGLVVGAALVIIGALLYWKGRGASPYFLSAGVLLIMSGLLLPSILKPLQRPWMMLAVVMNWFMTRFILSILFYLVFTPTGLIAKLCKKEFLELKFDKSSKTYWNKRTEDNTADYERQF